MQHTKSLTHVAWYVDVETGGVESFLSLKFYLYIYIYTNKLRKDMRTSGKHYVALEVFKSKENIVLYMFGKNLLKPKKIFFFLNNS